MYLIFFIIYCKNHVDTYHRFKKTFDECKDYVNNIVYIDYVQYMEDYFDINIGDDLYNNENYLKDAINKNKHELVECDVDDLVSYRNSKSLTDMDSIIYIISKDENNNQTFEYMIEEVVESTINHL